MNLPRPPAAYDANDEARTRGLLEQADRRTRKIGEDLELAVGERLVMTDTVTGDRGVISVESGVLTWTILP